MSEGIKTLIYGGVAAVTLILAVIVSWPSASVDPDVTFGKVLFEKFSDPLEARSFEIVRYDDVLNDVNRFTVNQVDERWVIPSHANYPADAEEQMKEAATALIGLKILGKQTEVDSEHARYGVVEPKSENFERGAQGIGTLVAMKDAKGEPLAELIIGKEVAEVENGHFVRVPGQSAVFVTEINDEKLSTKFEDWIEKDLLNINALSVEQVTFNDYSVTVQGNQVGMDRRLRMTVVNESNDWELKDFVRYAGLEERQVQLASSEELNSTNLNDLKNALDDLKIIDVRRKPEGLGADLRAGKGIQLDREVFTSLVSRGFIPVENQAGETEILSTNGDLAVATNDGVEYVLRFGDLATSKDSAELGKLNRYLMVAARFAEYKFPEPEYEEVPKLPAGPPAPAPKPDDDAGKKNDAEDASSDNEQDADGAAQDASDAGKQEDGGAENEGDDKPEGGDEKEEDDRTKLEAQIERIKKENQRKRDEWEENKKKAKAKVRELESRFADWYYVISEDVYEKIHLGRSDLIRERENVADEGFGIDAFRKLESDGLKKSDAAPDPSFP